jgi:hypothetical protein
MLLLGPIKILDWSWLMPGSYELGYSVEDIERLRTLNVVG